MSTNHPLHDLQKTFPVMQGKMSLLANKNRQGTTVQLNISKHVVVSDTRRNFDVAVTKKPRAILCNNHLKALFTSLSVLSEQVVFHSAMKFNLPHAKIVFYL